MKLTLSYFSFGLLLLGLLGSLSRGLASESQGTNDDQFTVRAKRQTSDSSTYFFYQQPEYPRDCKEVFEQCDGESSDGVYLIQPDGYLEPFSVYCNNTVDSGDWMVIQRRIDGGVDFNRDWNDYKQGFGFIHRDLWLGNDKLAYITNQKDYELRIDFVSKSGDPYFAKYNLFRISDEGTKYKLVGLGEYDLSSTVGNDAMSYYRGMAFSTRDRDNDLLSSRHCAEYHSNGWWFNACHHGMPNYPWRDGPYWNSFPGGNHNIQYVEMKIRPL